MKKKITFDYRIKSSPVILYNFLTQPEGLSQWFADHVDSFDKEYQFFWDGAMEKGTLLETVENEYVRYQIEDAEEGEYIEFKIEKAEISNDTLLFVTDFVEDYEVEDQKLYWDAQIDKLIGCIGAKN